MNREFDTETVSAMVTFRNIIIRDLIRRARDEAIPDSEGGWDIRYDVADWLEDQVTDDDDARTGEGKR